MIEINERYCYHLDDGTWHAGLHNIPLGTMKKEIAHRSGVPVKFVEKMLAALSDCTTEVLSMGKQVNFNKVGVLKLTFDPEPRLMGTNGRIGRGVSHTHFDVNSHLLKRALDVKRTLLIRRAELAAIAASAAAASSSSSSSSGGGGASASGIDRAPVP